MQRFEKVASFLGAAGLVVFFVLCLSTEASLTFKKVMFYAVVLPGAVMCGAHWAHLARRIDFKCKFSVVAMAAGTSFFLLACSAEVPRAFDRFFLQFIACAALVLVAIGALHMWQTPCSRRIRA